MRNTKIRQDFKNLWEFRMACMRRDWHLSGQTHCRPYYFDITEFPPAGIGKAGYAFAREEGEGLTVEEYYSRIN